MRKTIALAGAATALSIALAGCGAAASSSSPTGDTIKAGTLTVGISPTFPPMEYLDGSTLIGADVDLINEIGKRLSLKVDFVQESFDQLLNSVRTRRVDMLVSGMSDTVDRQQTVDFVDYYNSIGRFYTTAANAGKYSDDKQICGQSVAVSKKTDYYQALQTFSQTTCEGASLPAVDIIATDSGAAARLQLDQGRAAVAIQGGENLAFFDKETPGKYVIIGSPVTQAPFGAAVNKGNTALAESIRKTLQAMYDDGTTKTILTKYGLEAGLMPPAINSVK